MARTRNRTPTPSFKQAGSILSEFHLCVCARAPCYCHTKRGWFNRCLNFMSKTHFRLIPPLPLLLLVAFVREDFADHSVVFFFLSQPRSTNDDRIIYVTVDSKPVFSPFSRDHAKRVFSKKNPGFSSQIMFKNFEFFPISVALVCCHFPPLSCFVGIIGYFLLPSPLRQAVNSLREG